MTRKNDMLYFLYDISMERFLEENSNSNFIDFMRDLEKASRSFLWFYKKIKSKRDLIGYKLFRSKEEDRYKIYLIFEGLNIEVRASWIQRLGSLVEKYFSLDEELYISYESIVNNTFDRDIIIEA